MSIPMAPMGFQQRPGFAMQPQPEQKGLLNLASTQARQMPTTQQGILLEQLKMQQLQAGHKLSSFTTAPMTSGAN